MEPVVMSRESVMATESAVRPAERVATAEMRTAASGEMPTTTAGEMPTSATGVPTTTTAATAARVRRRAAGEDQHSDQCGQPN